MCNELLGENGHKKSDRFLSTLRPFKLMLSSECDLQGECVLELLEIHRFLFFYDHCPKVFDNVAKCILYSVVFTLLGAQVIAWQLTTMDRLKSLAF